MGPLNYSVLEIKGCVCVCVVSFVGCWGWEELGLGTLMIPIFYAHLFARTSLLLNPFPGFFILEIWRQEKCLEEITNTKCHLKLPFI